MYTWQTVQEGVSACGFDLATVHPFSLQMLSSWARGTVNDAGLLYGIGLPNSAFIELGECLLRFVHSFPT